MFEDRNVIRICDKWNIVLSLVAFIAAAAAVEVVFGLMPQRVLLTRTDSRSVRTLP